MQAGTGHHNYIDALRGYAILAVLLVHTLILTHEVSPLLWAQIGRGGYGVQLFFVISAMTLAQSWHRRSDGVRAFFVRRIFRIAPMFWLAIIAFYYLPWPWGDIWNHENATALHIALTATCAHGFHPHTFNQVVPGGWSIAVESMFYLVFPIIMGVATSLRYSVAILIATLATSWLSTQLAMGLFADSGVARPAIEYYSTHWLPAQLPVFMFGVVTYYLVAHSKWVRQESWEATGVLALGLTLLFLALPFLNMPQSVICSIYASVFAIIALGLARGAGQPLVNPAICWLGKISFSAYLWHFAILSVGAPIISSFSGTLPYLATVVVVLTLTTVASTATYFAIEKPMMRLGSKMANSACQKNVNIGDRTLSRASIVGARLTEERS